MEENRITAITKEKTDVLTEAYKYTLEILDAYDHQTLTRPEGTYYDGNETIEEVAVNMFRNKKSSQKQVGISHLLLTYHKSSVINKSTAER